MRTYRTDLEEFGGVGFEIQPFETAGGTQQREIASLNEQQATLLMTYMRNSDIVREFKKRLVKAFWDMARQLTQPTVPQSLPEALRLAAQAMEDAERAQTEKLEAESRLRIELEKVGQLSEQVAVAQPKAAALDRIALDCESSFTLRQAAAQLQMQEKAFLAWMHTSGLIYRSESGVWHAYAEPRKRLWLEHKLYPYIDSKDGETRHRTQVRVTARGMAKLAEMLEKGIAACPM